MIAVEVLVDKLNGMSCSEIREFLHSQGIQGEVSDEYHCPIARWIRRESGRWVGVGVQLKSEIGTVMGVRVYGDEPEETVAEYRMMAGPGDFVELFDKEEYPELISPTESYE